MKLSQGSWFENWYENVTFINVQSLNQTFVFHMMLQLMMKHNHTMFAYKMLSSSKDIQQNAGHRDTVILVNLPPIPNFATGAVIGSTNERMLELVTKKKNNSSYPAAPPRLRTRRVACCAVLGRGWRWDCERRYSTRRARRWSRCWQHCRERRREQ